MLAGAGIKTIGSATALLVLLVAVISYRVFNTPVYTPVVTIKYGELRGTVGTSRDGRTFHQFMGIRYAKAPVNELRFEVSLILSFLCRS